MRAAIVMMLLIACGGDRANVVDAMSEDVGPPLPQCDDHRDNDGDGHIDFPDDPGCPFAQADDETDDCPAGPMCPQCANGKDDDGQNGVDFPHDPGCSSANDPIEVTVDPAACGVGLQVEALAVPGMAAGELDVSSISNLTSPCGGGNGALAVAHRILLTQPAVIVVSTAGSAVDTIILLRDALCVDPSSNVACFDDDTSNKTFVKSLPAGIYYLILQSEGTPVLGHYEMQIDAFLPEGAACTSTQQCGPGLTCRTPHGGTQDVCARPVCNDGLDDDADGRIDYPTDPGCASPTDTDELDSCPNGASCPACSDGTDNDGDTRVDYPFDLSCPAASGPSETCLTSEPLLAITAATTAGSTVGAIDDYDPTCNAIGATAPDVFYQLDLPAMTQLRVEVTAPFDTVHTLLGASCGGTPLRCSDPNVMVVDNVAAGTYYVGVEGRTTSTGTFTIQTSGTVAAGGSCEGALFQSGAFTCVAPYVCDGVPGSRTCRSQCSDGVDNNGNGRTDYPNDPGCDSPGDNTEATVCPGAACPACSDGVDNDLDTAIDYPNDFGCASAGGPSEACTTSEPIVTITSGQTTGTTANQVNDSKPTCGNIAFHTAPDVMLALDLPALQSLTLTLAGFNGVHSLLDASCGSTPIACSDPGTMQLTNLHPGRYYVVVDGDISASGPFQLTTQGVIAVGGSCEGALFASNALTCIVGTTCQGPVGARICGSQCSDKIDNNGDGRIDFPADPGCFSLNDNSETTLCPGPNCPVCANGLDDDTDGRTDFPSDVGCTAASGTSEAFCPAEHDYAGAVTQPITLGTLAAPATDDFDQTCQSNTGRDVTFSLNLPVVVDTLTLTTAGSTIADTVLAFNLPSCPNNNQLGCDDDGDPAGNLSLLTLSQVLPGSYAIIVDAYNANGANDGPFQLQVHGTVSAGTACTAPLFATGVLACTTGTTCTAGTCQ